MLSEDNLSFLKELLGEINRSDLIVQHLVAEYSRDDTLLSPASKDVCNFEAIPRKEGTTNLCQDSPQYKDSASSDLGRYPDNFIFVDKNTPFKLSIATSRKVTTESYTLDSIGTNETKPRLREYQKELAEPALLEKNTIICAPTGCGKTIIAAEICKQFYDRSQNPKEFRALFIVNIRHLTIQQNIAFRTHFSVSDLGTLKDTDSLHAVIEGKKVVMITAQMLVNALEKDEVVLTYFNILIFDECHHTTLNHPYNTIMRNYLQVKKHGDAKQLPFILGLSASLGVGESGDASAHIVTLCANMDAICVSYVRHNVKELKEHVHDSPEYNCVCSVSPRPDEDQFRSILLCIMSDKENEYLGQQNINRGSQKYENWIVNLKMLAENMHDRVKIIICGYLRAINDAIMLYDNLRAIDAFEYVVNYFAKRSIAEDFISEEKSLRDEFEVNCKDKLHSFVKDEKTKDCPKLQKLVELLQTIFKQDEKSKGIVLCRTRAITKGLMAFLLKEVALSDLKLKPVRLIGQGQSRMPDKMTEAEQKDVLKLFREGKANILVATDLAQEGLDIPACNVVIRFNFVSNEIGTVQSRGRARATGQCYLIVERGSNIELHEEVNRQKVERMKQALLKLDDISEEQFKEQVMKEQEELIEIYEQGLLNSMTYQMGDKAEDVQLLCKECSSFMCYASELRSNGSHYTCISPQFSDRVKEFRYKPTQIQDFRTTANIGNVKCAKSDCSQVIGLRILFKVRQHEGYGLKVKNFIFHNPCRKKDPSWQLKKWKERTFEIKPE